MSKIVRLCRGAVGAAVCGLAVAPTGANGHGTVQVVYAPLLKVSLQTAEHEKITRIALKGQGFGEYTRTELAGQWAFCDLGEYLGFNRRPKCNLLSYEKDFGFWGAVGAPDWFSLVPKVFDKDIAERGHCDNGHPNQTPDPNKGANNLKACRTYIFDNLEAAIVYAAELVRSDLTIDKSEVETFQPCIWTSTPTTRTPGPSGKTRAKCQVLQSLGRAFHASQDIYSHSNWSDLNPKPGTDAEPAGLAMKVTMEFIDPTKSVTEPPAGLITGCYEGFEEDKHCNGFIKHKYLNKDFGDIDVRKSIFGSAKTSPEVGERGKSYGNFARAAELAADDTRLKWRYFVSQLILRYGPVRGDLIACVVRSDDPSGCKPRSEIF